MVALSSIKDIPHTLELLPHQQICFNHVTACMEVGRRPFILWFGGVRAGKTMGAVACLLKHSSERTNAHYIIGSVTGYAALNNIAPYFEQLYKEFYPSKTKITVRRTQTSPSITIGSNRFLIFPGFRADSSTRVQGLTADGLFLDEFSLLDRNFVKQCEARLSQPGAIRIYTSNKDKPYGWAFQEYFSKATELGALKIDVTSKDNSFLDQGYVEDLEKGMQGDDYRKYVLNEYVTEKIPVLGTVDYHKVKTSDPATFSIILRENGEVIQLPFWVRDNGPSYCGAPRYTGDKLEKRTDYLTNDPFFYQHFALRCYDVRGLAQYPHTTYIGEFAHALKPPRPLVVFSPDMEEHIETLGDLKKLTLVQKALLHGLNYLIRGVC